MSERGRVVGIFAAVALVAGGAGFYYFKVYQPGQDLKAAQAEITTWETRYQEARACLLGKSPASSKTSEALAIREMAPDPWDRGRCTPLVSKLSRGVGSDTGVESVEAAWTDLDKAAQAAASAFAKHVAGLVGDGVGENPLPAALDALDAARIKLRAAASLPAAQSAGTPLPPAQIVALEAGAEPSTSLFPRRPSAHGLVAEGGRNDRNVQIVLVPGAAPRAARVPTLGVRAVPDLSWGALGELLTVQGTGKAQTATGAIKVGVMDAAGAIATPQAVAVTVPEPPPPDPLPRLQPGETTHAVIPDTAIGSLADGAFTYTAGETLTIARAKADKVTADPPIKLADPATSSVDLDGRAAVVWTTLDHVVHALLLRKGGEETFELPGQVKGPPCLTNDRVWVPAIEPQLFAFGGGKPLERFDIAPDSDLVGCTADAAIVRSYRRHREVQICIDKCRNVSIPSGAPEYAQVTAIGGKLEAVAVHAGVVGVWSEDKPPVFYALPVRAIPMTEEMGPVMALTDGKVIDVIARSPDRFVLIRIPAP